MAGRIVALIARSESGDFLDGVTGQKLHCIAQGEDINSLVSQYRDIADNNGIMSAKKGEVQLREVVLMATHTAGGEMKSRRKW